MHTLNFNQPSLINPMYSTADEGLYIYFAVFMTCCFNYDYFITYPCIIIRFVLKSAHDLISLLFIHVKIIM